MESREKGSAWILAVAAGISGLMLGFVLQPKPPKPGLEAPAPIRAEEEPAAALSPLPPAIVLDGPLAYSLAGIEATVSKEIVPVRSLFDAQGLRDQAVECGASHPGGYFGRLMAKFEGSDANAYVFHYSKASQDPAEYTVTVVPNAPEYASLAEFRKDFDVCTAGAPRYPYMASPKWLVFVSACGSGFDDGSGLPIGCEEIRRAVEPTLQLKMQ